MMGRLDSGTDFSMQPVAATDTQSTLPDSRIPASVADLQRMAIATHQGLLPVYSRERGFEFVAPAEQRAARSHFGTQEILNLSEELLLIRTDWRNLCSEYLQQNRFDYDNRGWLYLHYRQCLQVAGGFSELRPVQRARVSCLFCLGTGTRMAG